MFQDLKEILEKIEDLEFLLQFCSVAVMRNLKQCRILLSMAKDAICKSSGTKLFP